MLLPPENYAPVSPARRLERCCGVASGSAEELLRGSGLHNSVGSASIGRDLLTGVRTVQIRIGRAVMRLELQLGLFDAANWVVRVILTCVRPRHALHPPFF